MKTNAGKLQERRLWSLPSSPLFENTGWNYTPEHLQFDGASNAKGTRTRPGHTGRLWVKKTGRTGKSKQGRTSSTSTLVWGKFSLLIDPRFWRQNLFVSKFRRGSKFEIEFCLHLVVYYTLGSLSELKLSLLR